VNRASRALVRTSAALLVLLGTVLLAEPAQAASPTGAPEPRRIVLIAIYALAVIGVAAVVLWAARSQWGRRATEATVDITEDER
jgi:hypothetical protein